MISSGGSGTSGNNNPGQSSSTSGSSSSTAPRFPPNIRPELVADAVLNGGGHHHHQHQHVLNFNQAPIGANAAAGGASGAPANNVAAMTAAGLNWDLVLAQNEEWNNVETVTNEALYAKMNWNQKTMNGLMRNEKN